MEPIKKGDKIKITPEFLDSRHNFNDSYLNSITIPKGECHLPYAPKAKVGITNSVIFEIELCQCYFSQSKKISSESNPPHLKSKIIFKDYERIVMDMRGYVGDDKASYVASAIYSVKYNCRENCWEIIPHAQDTKSGIIKIWCEEVWLEVGSDE